MIYTTERNENITDCIVKGIELPHPNSMTVSAINIELNVLCTMADKRSEEVGYDMVCSQRFSTDCEASRAHDLKMALPSTAELALGARERILARRAARKLERQAL